MTMATATRAAKKAGPGLLEAWLALTSVKYHGNLYILIPLNQRLALTRLRATGPGSATRVKIDSHIEHLSSLAETIPQISKIRVNLGKH